MTTALKLRRGTTSQHSTFTGADGEVTVDTTKKTVVVHDGATAGGFPLVRNGASDNVGIGTSSPSVKLDVNGGRSYFAANNEPYSIGVRYNGSTNGVYLGSPSADTLAISSWGGGERMRIDAAGNVNIGTTGVNEKLVVQGPVVSRGQLGNLWASTTVMDYNSSNLGRIIASGPDASTYPSIVFASTTSTTYAERMRITSNGNVGIGTTDPGSLSGGRQLIVENYSHATIAVKAIDGGNDRNASLELLSSGNGGSTSRIIYGDTDTSPASPSPLVFAGYHNGTLTERMRIASTGLITTNIEGSGTLYAAYDCRAWVNFNGTGTVAIRGSGNVSSITDRGTGQYTVNFTSAMPDANYSVSGTVSSDLTTQGIIFIGGNSSVVTTSSVRIDVTNPGVGNIDRQVVSVQIHR